MLNIRTSAFAIFVLVTLALAQIGTGLRSEMQSLDVHTALLIPSQAVDESPVWSPDSRYLGANIQGKWFKLDTFKVRLQEATWHRQRIGAVAVKSRLEPLDKRTAVDWDKQRHDTSYVGKTGLKAEFVQDELSTSLVVSQGTRRVVVWKSELESCGELTLSPDEAYVAYICETNGVLVMDIAEALRQFKARPDN